MNLMERVKSKKLFIKTIVGLTLLEFFFYGITLSNMISNLYEYKGSKRILTAAIAMNAGELITRSGIFKMFWILIILISILPAISFYQYYMGEKSIYTILRLPGKGARLKLYMMQMKDSVIGIFFCWTWQFLLLLSFYILYILVVPDRSQPFYVWGTMWGYHDIFQIYPFLKPWFLLPIFSMVVLLPAMTMLAVLTERSKKQCMLGIIGLMISFYGVYSLTTESVYCVLIVPFVTVITLGLGIYYIYKKQIV